MEERAQNEVSVTSHGAQFTSTYWSVVLAAGRGESAALEKLCCSYWRPLYAFARGSGHSVEDAADLTQEFFLRLLEKQWLSRVKREGGKFRSYLLKMFSHFLINDWHQARAQKRGGGKTIISIDLVATEAEYQRYFLEHATPEALYDQQWAQTVVDRVRDRLSEEYTARGQAELFQQLKGWLPGADSQRDYEAAAAALQMNRPAVRMAVSRLRQRFRELLRAEVAETVCTPEEIDEELRALIAALSRH